MDQGHSLQVAKRAITKLVTIVVGKQTVNNSTFYNMNKMYTLFHFFIKFIHLTFERGSCMDQDRQPFQTHNNPVCCHVPAISFATQVTTLVCDPTCGRGMKKVR